MVSVCAKPAGRRLQASGGPEKRPTIDVSASRHGHLAVDDREGGLQALMPSSETFALSK